MEGFYLTLFCPGESMNNLAITYHKLARNKEAAALFEKVLEFWRKLYKENHPSIGAHLLNMSS
jgi:hypothetical protein